MECKSKEVIAWTRKFIDMPELARDAGFTQHDDRRCSATAWPTEGDDSREARRLQGVRPVVPGRRRDAARARQTCRAAVERRAVFPERAPGRAGGQGVGRADQGASAGHARQARAVSHRRRLSAARVLRTRGRLLRRRSRSDTRASRRRARRWATRRRSARGCSRRARRSPTWTPTWRSTARAIRRTPPACSSRRAEVYEAQSRLDELRAHLRSYLDKWGKHGGLDRQMQAHFRLGELAWKASCARALGRRRLPARRPHDRDRAACR